MSSHLSPGEAAYVRTLAADYELRAWNLKPNECEEGTLPHREHMLHALALRLALGESSIEALRYLIEARGD